MSLETTQPSADAGAPSTRKRWLTPGRVCLGLLGLALAYGFLVFYGPTVTATRWEGDLKRELERVLGRPVELHDVRYSFYPSPGLSAKDLVIHEAPEFGIEPLAYVGEIRVGVRWFALLRGRLECSSVRLDDTSLNIARTEQAGWNFAVFLSQITAGLRSGSHAPAIHIRGGRINFRNGLRKSPFFLNAVDLDLQAPDKPGDEMSWTYEASPARTDRSEQGFGVFSGSGTWRPKGGGNGIVDVDLELERSEIAEVATLITGGDPGVQGRLSSRAHLSGPLDNVTLRGTLRLGDLKRPSLFGVRGRDWIVPYEGTLNLNAQTIEVRTVAPKDGEALPVNLRLTAEQFYTRPAWKAQLLMDGLPAATLLEVATRLGSNIPPGLKVDGTLSGTIDFSLGTPAAGEIELRNGALRLGDTGPYRIEPARFSLSGSQVTLAPGTLMLASGGSGGIEGEWDISTSRLDIRSTLHNSNLKDMRSALAAFTGLPPVPGMDGCTDGKLDGDLRFERPDEPALLTAASPAAPRDSDTAARWSGALRVADLQCAVDGASAPLVIEHGQLSMTGKAWHLRHAAGHLGALAWTGEASRQAPGDQPLRFAIAFDTLPAAEVENVFRPSLAYREGLLARTLAFRRSAPPDWLAARRWEGRVAAGEFVLAGQKYSKFNARVVWNGAFVDLADLSVAASGGLISGRGFVRPGPGGPAYGLRGVFDALNWEGHGTVEGEFGLTASGLGASLLSSLNATGQVTSRKLEMGGETFEQVAAGFDYDAPREPSRLRFSEVTALQDETPVLGSGGSAGDNRWHAELTAGSRVFKLTGTFPPFRLDTGASPDARTR